MKGANFRLINMTIANLLADSNHAKSPVIGNTRSLPVCLTCNI